MGGRHGGDVLLDEPAKGNLRGSDGVRPANRNDLRELHHASASETLQRRVCTHGMLVLAHTIIYSALQRSGITAYLLV